MNDTFKIRNGLQIESFSTGSTIFDIEGPQGQLFSVTDNLTGDIFKVSDITGIPILKVNSNGTTSTDGDLLVDGNISSLSGITAKNIYSTGQISGDTVVFANTGFKSKNICIEVNNSGVDDGRQSEINNYTGNLYLQYNSDKHTIISNGGGNVGINNNNPSSKLDIFGGLRITPTSDLVNYNEGIRINDGSNKYSTIVLGGTGTSGTSVSTWSLHKTPENHFDIRNNGNSSMFISSGLNIGINTTSPNYKLHVNGNIRGTDIWSDNGWFKSIGDNGWYSETHGGGIYMQDSVWVRTYGGKQFFVENNAYDSIRTSGGGVFEKGLTISGDTYITGKLTASSFVKSGSTNLDVLMGDGSTLKVASGNTFSLTTLANTIPVIKPDGVMEIGKFIDFHESNSNDYTTRLISNNGTFKINNAKLSIPSEAADALSVTGGITVAANGANSIIGGSLEVFTDLTVDGGIHGYGDVIIEANIYATGEITPNWSSDIRLKENINQINGGIDIIKQLNPVTYNWNELAKKLNTTKTDRLDSGLIAQELENILPNLVIEMHNGYKAIDYVKLIPYMISAIKDLQEQINYLRKS